MNILKELLQQTEKIDFLFPNNFDELMNNEYYDYDKFEWFLYYVFKLEGAKVDKLGKKGKGDGGADLVITLPLPEGGQRRIGVQAKYWKYKVGTEPINQLASAKARHNLTDLWIITTSDLTTDAKEIAESMNIKILRGEDVAKLITSVKVRHDADIEKNGQSSIEFLEIKPEVKTEVKVEKVTVDPLKDIETTDIDLFKQLRIDLSKKYNLYPIYNVYNNEMMAELIKLKPRNNEEIMKVKGFGKVKVDMLGDDIISFINEKYPLEKKNNTDFDKELYNLLIAERAKIAKFNKLSEENVYEDIVASRLTKMKPKKKEHLEKIYGFKKENIEIFGDYLVKVIQKYIDSK